MLKVKEGVVFKAFLPQVLGMLNALNKLSGSMRVNIVVTSGNDGKHSKESYHYKNLAIDIRIWGLSAEQIDNVMDKLQGLAFMGHTGYYDVVLEKDHIHAEFDENRWHRDLKKNKFRPVL